MSVWLADSCSD